MDQTKPIESKSSKKKRSKGKSSTESSGVSVVSQNCDISAEKINVNPIQNTIEVMKSQSPASKTVISSEKSREEVKAEREAKKLAKQAKKKEKGNSSKTDESVVKVVHETLKDKSILDSLSSPSQLTESSKSLIGVVSISEFSKNEQIDSIDDSNSRPNKSLEEIMAERESKKLAKQGKRKINKENKIPSNVNENIPPVVKDESEKMGTNQRLSETKSTKLPLISVDQKVEKTKAELKAERRAKQEAQRAMKEALKTNAESKTDIAAKTIKPVKSTVKLEQKETQLTTKMKDSPPKFGHKLFNHLVHAVPIEKSKESSLDKAIVELGNKYADRVVVGSNARTVALLSAIKCLIENHKVPPSSELVRSLESEIAKASSYLASRRPMAVAMVNALRHVKNHINHMTTQTLPEQEVRRKLCETIDTYVRDQVEVAGLAICNTVQQKIENGDIILTYGCSSIVLRAVEQAHRNGKKFSLVVVDGGPWYEGREMLRRLAAIGIKSTYVLISAVSFVMRKVSKVMVGAHALLANGYVMSRVGTSLVALVASSFNVPVLVLCETHKFSDRVQADAFVYNELGDPADVGMAGSHPNLTCLSLVYDVTPPELVTAVVTELAILPCTSVPVVLRVKPWDMH